MSGDEGTGERRARAPAPLDLVTIMEEVVEKLKILDYENGFCRKG